MKFALIFILASVYASPMLFGQSVGQSCQKNPNFNVTNFVVDPWPIYKSQSYSFSMTGEFLHKELLVQLTVGVKNGFNWNYTYFTINQNYEASATATFTYSLPGPPKSGSYTDQVTLHRPDYSQFACWEFSYAV